MVARDEVPPEQRQEPVRPVARRDQQPVIPPMRVMPTEAVDAGNPRPRQGRRPPRVAPHDRVARVNDAPGSPSNSSRRPAGWKTRTTVQECRSCRRLRDVLQQDHPVLIVEVDAELLRAHAFEVLVRRADTFPATRATGPNGASPVPRFRRRRRAIQPLTSAQRPTSAPPSAAPATPDPSPSTRPAARRREASRGRTGTRNARYDLPSITRGKLGSINSRSLPRL